MGLYFTKLKKPFIYTDKILNQKKYDWFPWRQKQQGINTTNLNDRPWGGLEPLYFDLRNWLPENLKPQTLGETYHRSKSNKITGERNQKLKEWFQHDMSDYVQEIRYKLMRLGLHSHVMDVPLSLTGLQFIPKTMLNVSWDDADYIGMAIQMVSHVYLFNIFYSWYQLYLLGFLIGNMVGYMNVLVSEDVY